MNLYNIMNQNLMSRKLAEQICQKKFEEYFKNKDIKLDKEIFKIQISLWKEIGKTHLTKYDLEKESPITQALNELCHEKIKWCMNKLLINDSENSENSESSENVEKGDMD